MDRSVNVTSQPFVNTNEVTFVRRRAVLQALHAAVIILLVEQRRKSQGEKSHTQVRPSNMKQDLKDKGRN